jgi:CheY-like chemotaxis protein
VFWFDVPLVDGEQDAEAGSIDRGSYLYYSPDEAEEAAADAAVEGGSGLLGLVTPELLKAMHAGTRRVRTHTSGSTNTTGSGASAGSGGRRSGGGDSMTSSIDSGGGSMDLNLPFASMSTTSTSDGEACIPCAFEQMGQVFGAGGGGGGVGAARGGGGGGSSPTLIAGRTTSRSPITRTGSLQTPSGPSLHSKGSRGRRAVSGRSDRSDGSEVDTWLEEEDEVEEGSAGRVLVVDDSVMVQKLLVAALTRQNFEVETAKNGREALEKMMKGSEPYLVVLMDFLMPVLDGITATAMYRQWESTVLRGGSNGSRGGSGGSGAAAEVGDNVPSETSSCSSNSGGSSGSHADHAASLTSLGSTDSWEPLPIMRLKRQTIIGISANAESADVETAKRAGLDHFLSKPVKVAQIVEYIKTIG